MTPTELLQLHIDNDQDTYKYWQNAALVLLKTPSTVTVWTENEFHRFKLAEAIEDQYSEKMPTVPMPYSDLLTHALGEIDYSSIAESILETAKEGL